ncbi:lipoprotein NlpI [Pseudoalteromonas denitrificans]|uniref:Lipoprotein NlpI n=1 Tax=Pseudoalteromonas denitrificans DSM 6059 TaxID=1123010 RepID=A0A1I1EZ93_9GAMM|nr:lipoprotein NlpI [Pseudoalteromonas denitrificans]SFB92046.1 lipoprotein NlpI [Pseudoalteromonas denitrificans DSM 6059]
MQLKKLLLGAFLGLSLAACQSTPEKQDLPVVNVAFTTPLESNARSELAIARYSELLYRANLTNEQKAQLYYDRGVLFDSLGMQTLAWIDFNRTIKLKPDLPEVYNFLGIHLTLRQQYTKAYEMFDSVLDLKPKHEYAYLNRGIALYYGDRAQLAKSDFTTFLEYAPDDAYRVVWLYLAEQAISKPEAVKHLKQHAKKLNSDNWAYQLVSLYSGELSEEDFLAGLDKNVGNQQQYAERLCEAYFYLAKQYQYAGNNLRAAEYFKLALATNVHEFVEYKYARLELQVLQNEAMALEAAKIVH